MIVSLGLELGSVLTLSKSSNTMYYIYIYKVVTMNCVIHANDWIEFRFVSQTKNQLWPQPGLACVPRKMDGAVRSGYPPLVWLGSLLFLTQSRTECSLDRTQTCTVSWNGNENSETASVQKKRGDHKFSALDQTICHIGRCDVQSTMNHYI